MLKKVLDMNMEKYIHYKRHCIFLCKKMVYLIESWEPVKIKKIANFNMGIYIKEILPLFGSVKRISTQNKTKIIV